MEVITTILMVFGAAMYAILTILFGFISIGYFTLAIATAIVPSKGQRRFDDDFWFSVKSTAWSTPVFVALLLVLYWLEGLS